MNIRKIITGLSLASILSISACSPRQENKTTPQESFYYSYQTPFQTANSFFRTLKKEDPTQLEILLGPTVLKRVQEEFGNKPSQEQLNELSEKERSVLNYLITRDPKLYRTAMFDMFNIPSDIEVSKLCIHALRFFYKEFNIAFGDTGIGVHLGRLDDTGVSLDKNGERSLPNFVNILKGEKIIPLPNLPNFALVKEGGLWRVYPASDWDYLYSEQLYTMEEFAYSPSGKLMAFISTQYTTPQLCIGGSNGENIIPLKNIESLRDDARIQEGYASLPAFIRDKNKLILQYYRLKTDGTKPQEALLRIGINEQDFLK